MLVTELIKLLQGVVDEHGDMQVGYIDNGDFAEHGGWTEPVVRVSSDTHKVGDGIKTTVL